jgi:hypothetical protein
MAQLPVEITAKGMAEMLYQDSDSDEYDEVEKKAREKQKRACERQELEDLLAEHIWSDDINVDGYTLKRPRLDDSEEEEEEVRSLPNTENSIVGGGYSDLEDNEPVVRDTAPVTRKSHEEKKNSGL